MKVEYTKYSIVITPETDMDKVYLFTVLGLSQNGTQDHDLQKRNELCVHYESDCAGVRIASVDPKTT